MDPDLSVDFFECVPSNDANFCLVPWVKKIEILKDLYVKYPFKFGMIVLYSCQFENLKIKILNNTKYEIILII